MDPIFESYKATTRPVTEGTSFNVQPGAPVKVANLKAGQKYFIYHKSSSGGFSDLMTFLGFSGIEEKYGEGGPKFKTLADVKKEYGASNMKDLENLDKKNNLPYGHNIYMWVQGEDGDKGAYYYIFKGRWVWGSSANQIAFSEVAKVTNEDVEEE